MHYTSYPFLAQFIIYLQFEKRYSQHTILSYQNDLQQFFSFVISQYDSIPIQEIKTPVIRSWLAELKAEGITSKSIRRKISSLKSLYKYLLKEGLVEQSPMTVITSPKINKRLPSFVEEQHMERLFNIVEFADNWIGKTERLLLELFYNTGMRVSELIALQEKDIDTANQQIKVFGKGGKQRLIPINTTLLHELQHYIAQKQPGTNNVFVTETGKALYARMVYNIVNKHLSTVTTIDKKSPHVLRHTFATHLANNGADLNAIKELLGHSSLAATQVYTHNTIEKLKDTFKKAHPKA